ncbi:MAG: DUF4912 domain-containing protein [Nitrospirae bacterium]|nr:DUF4912 domain-containing protein [Nitrospirota bacterium]
MKKKDLESMTIPQLKTLAGKLDVKLPSKMRKEDLVAALVPALRRKEKAGTPRRKALTSKLQGVKAKVLKKTKPAPVVTITPEERVEAAKFVVTVSSESRAESWAEPQVSAREFQKESLPEGYDGDYVRLMARDPYWAHAYWEVTLSALDRVRKLLKDPDARLTLRLYDATEARETGPAISLFDIEVFQRTGNWYIELGRPDRSFFVEIGLKTKDGKFHAISRSNIISTPRDRISDLTDLEWRVSEEEFQRLFALSGGRGIGISSAEMAGLREQGFPSGISSPTGWSPGGWSLFSPVGLRPEKERGFWFWVNTELIVYGATEPDAAVTFQGKPIALRPDGTFSLRFALPDGVQVMPVKAVSADKVEERTITPIVSRETK